MESSDLPSSPHTAPLILPDDSAEDISDQVDAQWEEEARLRQLTIQNSRPAPKSASSSERIERLTKGGFVDLGPITAEQEVSEGRSSFSG